MKQFIIRPMAPQDQEGKAYVHYQAWQETYPGLMPAPALASHTLEQCLATARRYPENTLVAVDQGAGDRIAGFVSYVPQARDFVSVPAASEISGLYLLKEYQRQGLGRGLLAACLELLPNPSVVLFVLQGNKNAESFYQHMGFRFTGHRLSDQLAGSPVTELEMLLSRSLPNSPIF